MQKEDLHWLAGILEGEGSFLAPPPSQPNSPRIVCSSTDEDVIARIALLFGQSYCSVGKARAEKNGWKPAWGVDLRGRKAVAMMGVLSPLMSVRRKEQIRKALSGYDPEKQASRLKLSDSQASQIKARLRDGERVKDLAKLFRVTLWTIYDIKNGRNRKYI